MQTIKVPVLNDDAVRRVMAAMLAYENMGCGRPKPQRVERIMGLAAIGAVVGTLVMHLAEGELETDEMAGHFVGEANHWHKQIKGKTDRCLQKAWPDVWAVLHGPESNMERDRRFGKGGSR